MFRGPPGSHKLRDDLSEGGGRGAFFFFQERCTSGFKPERPKASTRSGVMAAPQVAEDVPRGSPDRGSGICWRGLSRRPGPPSPGCTAPSPALVAAPPQVSHVKDRVTPSLGGDPPAARGAGLREAGPAPRGGAHAQSLGPRRPRRGAAERAPARAGPTRARAQGPARSEGGGRGAAQGRGGGGGDVASGEARARPRSPSASPEPGEGEALSRHAAGGGI